MPPTRKKKAQTTTKKPLAEKMDENDLTDDEVATNPRDDEIAKLQEEIHRLKLENASLRKSVAQNKTTQNASTPKSRRVTEVITPAKPRRNSTNSMQSMKQKERGCSCTGSCVNKKCGCVKKDAQCTDFCKCSDSCQNQMADIDEDKENEDDENTVIVEKKEISRPKVTQNQSKTSSSDSEPKTPTNYSPKNSENSSYSSNASTQTDEDEGNSPPKSGLNPMKPTRQLQRSPLQVPKSSPNTTSNTTNTTANTTVFNEDEVFLPMPKVEAEDELPPPDEIHQMEVDWDQHQANLVQCRKCKRKFHAYRIKKHEQSCKKI